jgi:hypothetical protein
MLAAALQPRFKARRKQRDREILYERRNKAVFFPSFGAF